MSTLHLIWFSRLLQAERSCSVSLPLPSSRAQVCTADTHIRSDKAPSGLEIHKRSKMPLHSSDWSHTRLDHLVWSTRQDTAGSFGSLLCNQGNERRSWGGSAILSHLHSLSGVITTVLAQLSSLLRQLHDKYCLLITTQNCKSCWSFHIFWY